MFCKRCGAQIADEDINLDRALAKCRICHAVFGFADEMASTKTRRREPVPMPERISLDVDTAGLKLVRAWWSPASAALLFFCIAWNGVLVFWYAMAATMDAPRTVMVLPILFILVGAGLVYASIAGLLNRSVIEVKDYFLTVRHGPLPWPGRQHVLNLQIDQIYCTEIRNYRENGVVRPRYCVHANLKSGARIKLLSGLPNAEQAIYVEQQLEKYLHMEDRPVAGELAR